MFDLGRLIYTLALDDAKFQEELKKSGKELDKFAKDCEKIGKTLSLSITAPLALAGVAAIKLAGDLEVAGKKFDKAFSGVGAKAQKELGKLTDEFGFSNLQAQKLLGSTADLLKGFGATSGQALETSTKVQQLAAALSAYNGIPVEEASQKITKALLGETEGLKDLGIAISADAVQAELLKTGQDKLTGTALNLAKSQVVLRLATEQSGDAIGAFADNQNTLNFQMNKVQGQLMDLGASFGDVLMPSVKAALGGVSDLIKYFTDMGPATKTTLIALAGLAAIAGPVALGMSAIKTSVLEAGAALKALIVTNPWLLAIAGAAALTLAIAGAVDESNKNEEANKRLSGSYVDLNKNVDKFVTANGEWQKKFPDDKKISGVADAFRQLGGSTALAAQAYEKLAKALASPERTEANYKLIQAQNDQYRKYGTLLDDISKKEDATNKLKIKIQINAQEGISNKYSIAELKRQEASLKALKDKLNDLEGYKKSQEEIAKLEYIASGKAEIDAENKRIATEKQAEIERQSEAEKIASQKLIKENTDKILKAEKDYQIQLKINNDLFNVKIGDGTDLLKVQEAQLQLNTDNENALRQQLSVWNSIGVTSTQNLSGISNGSEKVNEILKQLGIQIQENSQIDQTQTFVEAGKQSSLTTEQIQENSKKVREEINAISVEIERLFNSKLNANDIAIEPNTILKAFGLDDKEKIKEQFKFNDIQLKEYYTNWLNYLTTEYDKFKNLENDLTTFKELSFKERSKSLDTQLQNEDTSITYWETHGIISKTKAEELRTALAKKGAEDRAKIIQDEYTKINTEVQRYLGNLSTISSSITNIFSNDLTRTTNEQIAALDEQTKARLNSIDEQLVAETEYQAQITKIQTDAELERSRAYQDHLDQEAQLKTEYSGIELAIKLADLDKEYAKSIETSNKTTQRQIQDLDKVDIAKKAIEDEQDRIKEEQAKREYDIKKEAAQKEYDIQLEGWKWSQALSIAQATANIPLLVLNALTGTAIYGPIVSGLAGVAAGVAGAAALAQIISTPPPAKPRLAEGGIITPTIGGRSVTIGEAGSPEAVMPLNDAFFNRLADAATGANYGSLSNNNNRGNTIIPIYLDGKMITEVVVDNINNRQSFIQSSSIV